MNKKNINIQENFNLGLQNFKKNNFKEAENFFTEVLNSNSDHLESIFFLGILEAKKISAIAEASGVQIAPHLYCGPIVAAANIQIATCIPNFLILESIKKMEGFYAKILKKPIQWKNGFIIPPKDPGLGIEIDESVISEYPYDEKKLHLQVSNKLIDL